MSTQVTLATSERGDLRVVELAAMRDVGVDAFITTRDGGVSEAPYDRLNLATHVGDDPERVHENRRRVAAAANVAPSHLVMSHQVHGAGVSDVDRWAGEDLEGDALVTTRGALALCVLVADCVPMLFVAGDGERLAVAHAGWRGLVAGVIPATLTHFTRPREVRVVVGPHISAQRYQVGPDVAHHFAHIEGALGEDHGDRQRLDLGAVVRHQLSRAGVPDGNVSALALSTDDTTVFFSDRAQRPCGRFALVARRLDDGASTRGAP